MIFNRMIVYLFFTRLILSCDIVLAGDSALSSPIVTSRITLETKDNRDEAFNKEVFNFRQKNSRNENPIRSFLKLSIKNQDGSYYRYALKLPRNYEETSNYPLIVFLHGGLSNRPWKNTDVWWHDYLKTETQNFIALYPSATLFNPWWSDNQTETLRALIKDTKHKYSIDPNKVFVVGISDGGAGAIYQGVMLKELVAGAVSVIGSPSVLAAKENAVEQNIYEPNLANLPLLLINSESDPLYPANKIAAIVKYLQRFSPQLQLKSVKGRHNLKVVHDNENFIHQFIKENSRVLYPDSITWQMETDTKRQRNHWISVDSPKQFKSSRALSTGLRNLNLETALIKIEKNENSISVQLSKPLRLTFLLSPEHFDFQLPINVAVNGTRIFSGKVEKNIDVLKKWVEIDTNADRIYGAELTFAQSEIASKVNFR